MTLREKKNHYLRMRYLLMTYAESTDCSKADGRKIMYEIERIDFVLEVLFGIEDTGIQPEPVVQLTLEGECVAIWPSLKDITAYYGTSKQKISDCMHHRKDNHLGFVWRKLGDSLGNNPKVISPFWSEQSLFEAVEKEYKLEKETRQERREYLAQGKDRTNNPL